MLGGEQRAEGGVSNTGIVAQANFIPSLDALFFVFFLEVVVLFLARAPARSVIRTFSLTQTSLLSFTFRPFGEFEWQQFIVCKLL